MVQMDGSHHDWLEGRGDELVLMAYIDDATNRVFARFYEYEGTIPAMDGFKGYIGQYGIPQWIYLDRHLTDKSTAKPTIEDELNNRRPMSQFERGLEEKSYTCHFILNYFVCKITTSISEGFNNNIKRLSLIA